MIADIDLDERKNERPRFHKMIREGGWFALTRAAETVADSLAIELILSKIDSENRSAAHLMTVTSLRIILRGVNATLLYYTAPHVREHKEHPQKVKKILHNSWLFALPLGMGAMVIALCSAPILRSLGESETSAHIAGNFLAAYGPGLLPTLLVISNQQTLLGLGNAKTVLLMTALHTPLILLLGYPLTFTLGLKETGLGIAYSVAASAHFLSYLVLFRKKFREYDLLKLDRSLWRRDGECLFLARKGFWIGVYAFLELSNVWVTIALIGSMPDGGTDLSALSPGLQYASIIANMMFAFGHSVGIPVKGSCAESKYNEAKQLGHAGIGISFALPLSFLLLFAIDQDLLLKPFLGDDTTALARSFLLINLVGQVMDALRNSASGALRGLGDTASAALVNTASVFLLTTPLSLAARFALNWGPEAILGIRIAGIGIGGAAIGYEWMKQSKRLPEDGFSALPEEKDEGAPRGCLHRLRHYFWPRQPNESQIQHQNAGCVIG